MKTPPPDRVAKALALQSQLEVVTRQLARSKGQRPPALKGPLWARAYRGFARSPRGKGKPLDTGTGELLRDILAAHLPAFWETEEGQAIRESQQQAFQRAKKKALAGKVDAQLAGDELALGLAQLDFAGACRNGWLPGYIAKHREQARFSIRLGDRLKTPPPTLTVFDYIMLGGWTRPFGCLPPLCFLTASVGAEVMTLAGHETSEDTFRQWRRRWKLRRAHFTLLRKVSKDARGRVVLT